MLLLGTAFCPPVSYFALIAEGMILSPDGVVPSTVFIEAHENYQKQSWRNRCRIYASDGPQFLSFPVKHEGGTHEPPIGRIKVDYSTPWVVRMERTIASAYRSSAYFDHYKDDLFGILESGTATLFDLNLQLIKFFLRKTGISADIRLTGEYLKPSEYNGCYGPDFRERLHPKRPDDTLSDLGLEKPYFQVFALKHGFIPNLSIMDLLFNEGPDSILFLKRL